MAADSAVITGDVMEGPRLAGLQGVASPGRRLCPSPSRPGRARRSPKALRPRPELEKRTETLNKGTATHQRVCHKEPGNHHIKPGLGEGSSREAAPPRGPGARSAQRRNRDPSSLGPGTGCARGLRGERGH